MQRLKKLTAIFLTLNFLFAHLTFAQILIPNESFEEWTALDNGKEGLVNWMGNDLLDTNGQNHLYCVKTTDSYDGDYAFSLVNKHQGSACYASYIDLGEYDPTDLSNRGIDFSERPTALAFYYKFYTESIFSFHKGKATISLKRWDEFSNQEIIIGEGTVEFSENVSEYTYMEVPVNYTSNDTPEKLHIRFSNPCDPDSVSLSIDYVGLVGLEPTSNNELTLIKDIKSVPNPANNYFRLSNFEENGEVDLFNNVGQLVKSYALTERNENLDVSSLNTGLYFYRLRQGGVIKSTGKINVQH